MTWISPRYHVKDRYVVSSTRGYCHLFWNTIWPVKRCAYHRHPGKQRNSALDISVSAVFAGGPLSFCFEPFAWTYGTHKESALLNYDWFTDNLLRYTYIVPSLNCQNEQPTGLIICTYCFDGFRKLISLYGPIHVSHSLQENVSRVVGLAMCPPATVTHTHELKLTYWSCAPVVVFVCKKPSILCHALIRSGELWGRIDGNQFTNTAIHKWYMWI